MTDHTTATAASITRWVAQHESHLAAAIADHGSREKEAANLEARLDAMQQQVQALRSIAAERDLTDKEAAALNLAVLDVGDLGPLAAEARARASVAAAAIEPARAVLKTANEELTRVTAAMRRDALVEQARELERQLCDCLNEAWAAAREANPAMRFVAVWQPGDELRRAAVHHQPPMFGAIS